MNYNTSEFLQSLDRIHRVGGSEKNPVFYYFLQYENSIDVKIYERVFEKANRQMQVIEEDNLNFIKNNQGAVVYCSFFNLRRVLICTRTRKKM